VIVIEAVIVAVHGNGNDPVIVIPPVDGGCATARERRSIARLPIGHGDLVDQLRRAAQSTPQNIA
jgi:hypothetical protein